MRLTFLMRLLAICGFALVVSACATRGGTIPYNQTGFVAPDAPKALTTSDTYKLAPLDVVTVTVFQVPDLSKEYPIDYTGRFTMPLVGNIQATGMSTSELAAALEAKLGAKYLRDPNVTVALKESGSRMVTVDGSVREPGVFPALGPLTLMQTVALAKGVDNSANPRRVAVFRVIGGKRMAAAFDLTDIRRGKQEDPQIYAGDTVIVDGSRLKQAQAQLFATIPLLPFFTTIL